MKKLLLALILALGSFNLESKDLDKPVSKQRLNGFKRIGNSSSQFNGIFNLKGGL